MARSLAPGLLLVFLLLSFNLNLHTTRCNLFYLWTSTYTHRVFICTGFGLSTFTADTTGPARFPFAISKWLHLFLRTTKFSRKSNVTTLQRHFGQQDDCNLPIHQLPAQCRCFIHLLPAFHLPVPLPESLFLHPATHKLPNFPCRQLTLFILNHNTFCRGTLLDQRQLLYSK